MSKDVQRKVLEEAINAKIEKLAQLASVFGYWHTSVTVSRLKHLIEEAEELTKALGEL